MKTFFKIIIFLVIYITGLVSIALTTEKGWVVLVGGILSQIIYVPAMLFWWDYVSKTMDKKDEQ